MKVVKDTGDNMSLLDKFEAWCERMAKILF